jgi:hypothetical protein
MIRAYGSSGWTHTYDTNGLKSFAAKWFEPTALRVWMHTADIKALKSVWPKNICSLGEP